MKLLIAFHHVTLIDGTGREPVRDATVAIREGRIVYAGTSRTWLPSLEEDILNIDFSGKYLLPGLIDCQVHLARSGEAHGRMQGEDGAVALRMLLNAQRNLAAGITTVRDPGGWNGLEFSVREALQRGDFCGPRLVLGGKCITGSQAAAAQSAGSFRLAKGPDQVRSAARENLRRGAEALDLCADSPLLIQQDVPAALQLTADEMQAAVQEAHSAGRRAVARARGVEGIRQAVLAGADVIQHGSYLHKSRELVEQMKARGTFLVPALSAGRVLAQGGTSRVPSWIVERLIDAHEAAKKSLRLAHQAGIPVAMGSSAGTPLNRHGENGLEALSLQGAGMKPMEALVASTLTAARALGLEEQIGSIEENKIADLLVLDSDPLEDLQRLADRRQIRAVFTGGRVAARRPSDSYPKTILVRDNLQLGQ